MSDLKRALTALLGKQRAFDTAFAYYDGDHPLVYTAKRLAQVFEGIDARFSENWCAAVVDAMHERVRLESFVVEDDDAATERLNELWHDTEMHLDDDDAHLAALVCGESFLIAWREADRPVEAYYNDPRLCHVEYDPAHPREKLWAAKWWLDAEEKRHLTLYYPDRLEYYVTESEAKDLTSLSETSFRPDEPDTADNPYGVIPVFHIRRTRRTTKSELANVIEPQNLINKLLADMMVAAEFGAFRQRYIITNADLANLKNSPGVLWNIPAGDGEDEGTKIGEFGQTDLKPYLDAIEREARAVAVITRTPKHYLMQQGGDPSGEALIAMEAPLNAKVEMFIEHARLPVEQFAAFLLQLDGNEVDPATVQAVYAEPRTVQPLTQSMIATNLSSFGNPRGALKGAGYTDDEADTIVYGEPGAGQSRAQQVTTPALQTRAERLAASLTEAENAST